jgi:predicted permease
VLTLQVAIPEDAVKEADRVARMDAAIQRNLQEIPGVTAAAFVNSIPMGESHDNDPIFVADRTYADSKVPPLRRFKFISPDYFKTMGNAILAGRDLSWTDIENRSAVVLVSENLAQEYWHNPAAAIGKRIRENLTDDWREIIGVVRNERDDGVNLKAPAIVYWPFVMKQYWGMKPMVVRSLAFAVRSPRTGSSGFLKEIQQAVWSVDPNLPLARVRTLGEVYRKSMARTSFTLVMLALAGGMALLLGLVGIYGVISYSVSQRTREIGIRLALGAREQTVRRMFVRHGLALTGIGLVAGLAAAAALMRLMSSLLFEVSPVDPMTYGAVSLSLIVAAVLASYIPARRATAVDPVEALRAE